MLCNYGCGQEATHQFKNGRWCCSDYFVKCPGVIQKNRDANRKERADPNSIFNTKEYKQRHRKSLIGRISWNKGKTKENDIGVFKQSISLKNTWSNEYSFLNSEEFKAKQIICQNKSDVRKRKSIGKKDSVETVKKKYPIFSKIEEIRCNPNKPGEKEVQVRCKNHECKNSKEQGGWFTPTYIQFYERIRQLEKDYGNDGSYFYCCQACKTECPLYNLKSDPFKNKELPYTQEDLQTWKEQVKKLDNSKCQLCGTTENIHVHHIIPQKLEPFFILDPINGVCLCKKCHYKYGHKIGTECSTSYLANKNC